MSTALEKLKRTLDEEIEAKDWKRLHAFLARETGLGKGYFKNAEVLPSEIFLGTDPDLLWLCQHEGIDILAQQHGLLLRANRRINVFEDLLVCTDLPEYAGEGRVFSWTDEAKILLKVYRQHVGFRRPVRVLDIGTGAGTIALALAKDLAAGSTILGVDREERCIRMAELNKRLNLHAGQADLERVDFCVADLFEHEAIRRDKFDLIIADPPFRLRPGDDEIAESEIGTTTVTRRIISEAKEHLKVDGHLLLLTYALSTAKEKKPTALLTEIKRTFFGTQSCDRHVSWGTAGDYVCRFGERKAIKRNPMAVEYNIIQSIQAWDDERRRDGTMNNAAALYKRISDWLDMIEKLKVNKKTHLHYVWIDVHNVGSRSK
jgi:SAM-dependent methyltransferase